MEQKDEETLLDNKQEKTQIKKDILVVIPFSHFVERARWVLDLAHIQYTEKAYLPLFHISGVAWSLYSERGTMEGKKDKVSSPFSTPMLITCRSSRSSNNKNINGSSSIEKVSTFHDSLDIMLHANEILKNQHSGANKIDLFPAPLQEDILSTCTYLHNFLGPVVRSWAYSYVLYNPHLYIKTAWYNPISWAQRLGWYLGSLLIIPTLGLLLKAYPLQSSTLLLENKLRQVFATISKQLEERSKNYNDKKKKTFLCGDTLTIADITFASLGAIVIGIGSDINSHTSSNSTTTTITLSNGKKVEIENVKGYGHKHKCYIPAVTAMPSSAQDFMYELQMTPAGQHILRMYKEYRKV